MKNLTDKERMIADVEYYKHRHDNLILLTREEAKELLNAWEMESIRRYGKVNTEAPLYLKLSLQREPTD